MDRTVPAVGSRGTVSAAVTEGEDSKRTAAHTSAKLRHCMGLAQPTERPQALQAAVYEGYDGFSA
jgi:hypothetical protein